MTQPMFKSIRKPQPKLPLLVLTSIHRRDAMRVDLSAAVKRRDMRAVGQIERQLARLTSRMLAKGA